MKPFCNDIPDIFILASCLVSREIARSNPAGISGRVVDLSASPWPLGSLLGTRFDQLGNPIDIENSILNSQKAVDLTPDGRPDKPRYLLTTTRLSELEGISAGGDGKQQTHIL